MRYYPEGTILDSLENRYYLSSPATLAEARDKQILLESRAVVCTEHHDLVVELPCMKGIIPREEAALGIREGTVRDVAILSRVNRPVCFYVQGLTQDEQGRLVARLSRREAQEKCRREYLSARRPGDVLDGRITHLERFGAFVDIGCGLVSLLPIDAISVSRIDHPRERFSVGMEVRVIVKSRENGRITLSHKELLGTWEENAARFHLGETVAGIVRSVEPYGVFVELAPNLAGLAEVRQDVVPGQQASVFIKSILPQRMKVKLVLIETFDPPAERPKAPEYFFHGDHLDQFVYSPADCEKTVLTRFDDDSSS